MLFDRLKRIVEANVSDAWEKIEELRNNGKGMDIDSMWEEYKKKYIQSETKSEAKSNTTFNEKKGPKSKFSAVELTYYEVLEVPPGANIDTIKASYKKLMKKYHPDRFHNSPEKQEVAMKIASKINEAYAYFEKKDTK